MSKKEIQASVFKAQCLRIMEEVSKTKKIVTITKRHKALVKIVPVAQTRKHKFFGSMKGSVEILGDIISPINEAWHAES